MPCATMNEHPHVAPCVGLWFDCVCVKETEPKGGIMKSDQTAHQTPFRFQGTQT